MTVRVAVFRPRVPAKQATVYIPSPLHPVAARLALQSFHTVLFADTPPDKALPLADGIVLRQGSLSEEALRSAPRCAAITRTGAGWDTVPAQACRDLGVAVGILPGMNSETVAELTLGLTLGLLRRINEIASQLSQGIMVKSIDHLGRTLHGKHVGLVGMGAIARSVALLFWTAFKTPIHVFSPTSPLDRCPDIPHTRHSSLATFLPALDVLSLHCPLVSATRNLISDAELAMLRPSAVVVNTARGGIVDEAALERALRSNQLAGAAIDVWEVEPLVDFDRYKGLLTTGKNVIALPHIGSSTEEMTEQTCVAAVEHLKLYLDGEDLPGRVV